MTHVDAVCDGIQRSGGLLVVERDSLHIVCVSYSHTGHTVSELEEGSHSLHVDLLLHNFPSLVPDEYVLLGEFQNSVKQESG
jgi:hypothetical protein